MGNVSETMGTAIAGIVVCIVAILVGIGLMIWLLQYAYGRGQHHHHHRRAVTTDTNEYNLEGQPGLVQPTLQASVHIPGGGRSNSARF